MHTCRKQAGMADIQRLIKFSDKNRIEAQAMEKATGPDMQDLYISREIKGSSETKADKSNSLQSRWLRANSLGRNRKGDVFTGMWVFISLLFDSVFSHGSDLLTGRSINSCHLHPLPHSHS